MLAPTNKYSKGSKKVKNSRKNVTKNKVVLFIKDNPMGYYTYYTGQFVGDVTLCHPNVNAC